MAFSTFTYDNVSEFEIGRLLEAIALGGGSATGPRWKASGEKVWDVSLNGIDAMVYYGGKVSLRLSVEILAKHGFAAFIEDSRVDQRIREKLGRA